MRWLPGVAAIAAFVAAGCGGTVGASAGGADIVPATAPAFIAVNTDTESSQWQTVDDLSQRFPDRNKAMQTFHEALQSEGLSWKRDVKPAIGPEVDFVWLDFAHDGEDFVVLLQPDDDKKFDKLITKEASASDFFHAKIGDWQVMAPRQDLLDRFRRDSDSGETLADRKPFQQAMKTYPDDYLVRAYVDGAALMRLARRDADPEFKKMLPKLGTLDWFATNLSVTSDGVRWDSNVHGTPGPAFKGISPTRAFRPTLSHEVPKDAIAYFTFHGTKGMLTGLEKNPLFNDVSELHRYAGVLRRIESLLQGENALWVRPSSSGKIPEVTFVAEPAAGTDGAATLDRLLSRYRKQLELRSLPKRTTVAGVPARVFYADPVHVYYANVGKRLVVTDEAAGIRTLKGNPPSLEESSEYNDTLDSAGMPDKTQGFLYVNVKGGLRYAQRLAQVPLPGEVKRNLRPLRSAVEYGATRPSELQITFFLRIS